MSQAAPVLEKYVWSDSDFERMGWHDCPVHGYAAFPESEELAFDLDYIVKWEDPGASGGSYSFWISPATLVFHGVHLERICIEGHDGLLTIDEVVREDQADSPAKRWTISGHDGEAALAATGFTQYLRADPVLVPEQWLPSAVRGGCTFARCTPGGPSERSVEG